MIVYDPFWETLAKSGLTKYKLVHKHGISQSTITRINKSKLISLDTVDKLCRILNCEISGIIKYVADESINNS